MNHLTQEQIRRRAYEVYLRDRKPGQDLENWFQAERELKESLEGQESISSDTEAEPIFNVPKGKKFSTVQS